MADFVCSVDMGTTRIKAALLDPDCRLVGLSSAAAGKAGGFSCFDAACQASIAHQLIATVLATSGVPASSVHAVAVTGQRATVVPIGSDGLVAGPALSWQDSRGEPAMMRFCRALGEGRFQELTGLPPSSLWSLGKLLWCREAEPELWRAATRWVLLNDYMLQSLGTDTFYTEPSGASLTGLWNLLLQGWSEELLGHAAIAPAQLPVAVGSGTQVGTLSLRAAQATGLTQGTPLVTGGGDQQCAAYGLGVQEPGSAALTLGTSAVLVCPTDGEELLATGIFHTAHVAGARILREGILNSAGSSISWASAALGVSPSELHDLAARGPLGASGVLYLPFLAGAGSPDFVSRMQGVFAGIHLETSRECLARAVLEGIALELRRVLEVVAAGLYVRSIRVAGGPVTQELLLSILADTTGCELIMDQAHQEAALAGAARLAWSGIGHVTTPGCGANHPGGQPVHIKPSSSSAAYDKLFHRYVRWVDQLRQLSVDAAAQGY